MAGFPKMPSWGSAFPVRKEKLIREIFINDDVIEAIISLPPGLFYGTGIPACVIVANKNKFEVLKDKVLFINADREYAEGKAQNKLRPEDIEKIDFVFTHKREIPKYSRLVDKAEIVNTHDYNLNIRRYVDNTPDPEPEDVQAHLIGGIPEAEVSARAADFARFGIQPNTLFEPGRTGYLAFPPRNSTPWGMMVAMWPCGFKLASMCCTNIKSAFLPVSGHHSRKRLGNFRVARL